MAKEVFPEFSGEAYQSRRAVRLTLYLPDADAAWAKARSRLQVLSPLWDGLLGRPLWRGGGSVRVRLGNRSALLRPERSRNCGAAKESWRPLPRA